jgi:hypothetical protein
MGGEDVCGRKAPLTQGRAAAQACPRDSYEGAGSWCRRGVMDRSPSTLSGGSAVRRSFAHVAKVMTGLAILTSSSEDVHWYRGWITLIQSADTGKN